MFEFAVVDAESTLDALLNRVESGEEILITRHGKAIARLVPNSGIAGRASLRIRQRAAREGLTFDFEQFKRDRDTGRR